MGCSKTDHCFKSSDSNGNRDFVLIIRLCLESDHGISMCNVLYRFCFELWCFLALCKLNILLEEVFSNNILFISTTLHSRIEFFKDRCAVTLITIKLCHCWFNNEIVIVVVKVLDYIRHIVALVSVICDNSFSNFSILFSIFLIKHHEEKIES
jgi:hypothetical protein